MGLCSTLAHICSELLRADMASAETATLTLCSDPALKEALRPAAEREHRSIASMVEVLIRDHCRRNGIAATDPTIDK